MTADILKTIPCEEGTQIEVFYCEGTERPYGVRLYDTTENCVPAEAPIYRFATLDAAIRCADDNA